MGRFAKETPREARDRVESSGGESFAPNPILDDQSTPARANDIPRRIRLDQNVPAELAIRQAIHAVEDMPADVRLTDAVVLLGQALNRVADYVDGQD